MDLSIIYLKNNFFRDFFINLLNYFSGTYTRKILLEAVTLLNDLWLYLLTGILLTSLIKILIPKETIADFFKNRKSYSIILGALLGVVSPLGSYVVIPMSAALFTLGTPMPVLMAFLVSSPLIDPNLFLLTVGAFGYELAVVRTISAFVIGITAGYSTLWLLKIGFLQHESIVNNQYIDQLNHSTRSIPEKKFIRKFFTETYKMFVYIGKYFFLSIILAAVVKILTPPNLIMRLFGQENMLSVLLSAGAGVPFYACGGAAIPVVQELASMGLNKGAVLAFFISGPVTKISNMVLMWAAFKTKVFLLYVIIGIFGAVLLGYVYNFY
jgi:uncharacterized membrane protein YraQ (UPF0718 family)